MNRFQILALAFVSVACFAPRASAQFLYLRPDTPSAGTFSLVFHSAPLTDSATTAKSLGIGTVTILTEGGKRTQVAVEKGDTSVTLNATANTLFTSADYGVSNRGEGHLVLLRYHAKVQPTGGAAVGLPLELVPKSAAGGVAFVATAGGKPLAHVSVTVHEPGATAPRTVTTDADGQTPTYTKSGRYAARVGRFEKQKGELEGKAYTGVWEYSTLVTEVK